MAEPDATQVVAGSGVIYVAPLGTALPVTGAHGEYPITWPDGWRPLGYTDDGADVAYNPSITEITVDEEASPVADVLAKEEFMISVKMAEATLENLNAAISASTLVDSSTTLSEINVNAGSQALNYLMVGLECPAPGTNKRRLWIVRKAIPNAAVSMKIQRKDKVVIPVSFAARKLSGFNLFDVWDLTSTAS